MFKSENGKKVLQIDPKGLLRVLKGKNRAPKGRIRVSECQKFKILSSQVSR